MKRFVLAALAVLVTAGVAAADAPVAADIFAKRCAACHGKGGKGDTPMAQKLGAKDISALPGSEADIQKAIESGKGKMPAFKGKITDAEIASLAKYVKAGLK
jgi:mono/diheme cytochrome c family protein